MSNKSYTILVTSNSDTKVKSVTVSRAWMNALLFMGLVLLLILFCVLADYIKVLSTHNQNNELLSENLILKQKFQLVENKLLTVEKKLKRVNHISEKIDNLSFSINQKTPNNFIRKGADSKVVVNKVEQSEIAIGPLQASLTPMQRFFDKLKFLKKAPLQDLNINNKMMERVGNVDEKIFNILKESERQELIALDNWEGLTRQKSLFDSTPNVKPVRTGWFTSKFGMRSDPFTGASTMHAGLDIAAAPGTPVYSPADGIVSYVGFENGYGNLVTIDHGYGVKTRYAHNSEIFVKFGQKLKRGHKISAVGNTGRSSGYHLHYEVRLNGIAVNPLNYIFE